MTIFGLNSPEISAFFIIIMIILGTKRIEKGLNLFSRLLKFLLSNENSFDNIDKKNDSRKDIEVTHEKEEVITKIIETAKSKEIEPIKEIKESKEKEEEVSNIVKSAKSKEKEPIKGIKETNEKENKSEKRLKISNVENKGKNSITTNVPKGIKKDKTVNKLKTKVPKRILKEKTARKSKTINQEEQQDT